MSQRTTDIVTLVSRFDESHIALSEARHRVAMAQHDIVNQLVKRARPECLKIHWPALRAYIHNMEIRSDPDEIRSV